MYDQQKDEIPRYLEHLDKSFVCLWYSACNSLVITISMKQRDKHCLRLLKEDANQSFATPCHNTPSWLIKFDGQLYQMLYINLRRCYKSSVSGILLLIQRRRAWVVECFGQKPNWLLCKIENFSRWIMILLYINFSIHLLNMESKEISL